MASAFTLSTNTANLIATQLNTSATYGFTSAHLKIYDGTIPANPETAVSTQNMLADFTLPASGSNTVTGNQITFGTISNVTAAYSSTATWFRVFSSSGSNAVCDGSVGTSGADLNINSVAISSGATVSISSFVYTVTK